MKRLGVATAVMVLSLWGVAQTPQAGGGGGAKAGDARPGDTTPRVQSPEEGASANRNQFGQACGIGDSSAQRAIGLLRSAAGEWKVAEAGQRPGPEDNASARVWREHTWMVVLHDVPGATMHSAQMCFAPNGQLLFLVDDYVDISSCACLRSTSQRFDLSGRMVERKQTFNSMETGAEIEAPEAAKGFPGVFGYRRVEQLPFYMLLKR